MTKAALVILLMMPLSGFAELLSFGVKGGLPFTDAFDTATTGRFSAVSDTKHYTVGPVVELHLPFGLGVEFNALYKRLNYDVTELRESGQVLSSTTANSWEFPLLFKARLGSGGLRPYLVIGPNVRHLSDLNQAVRDFLGRREFDRPTELENRLSAGISFGGGLQFGGEGLKISPEIRYTRWGRENFAHPVSTVLSSNLNQAEFLLGITF